VKISGNLNIFEPRKLVQQNSRSCCRYNYYGTARILTYQLTTLLYEMSYKHFPYNRSNTLGGRR